MASANSVPDVWEWINNLPPIDQWNRSSFSLCICASMSLKPCLNLSITRSTHKSNPFVSISLCADYNTAISLWTSNPIHLKAMSRHCFDEDELSIFLFDIVNGVLKYGPCNSTASSSNIKFPKLQIRAESFRDVFNLAFLTLVFLVCIYEAPQDLRHGCLNSLSFQMITTKSIGSLKVLFRFLGSNMEERWMRSINLAVTNWISELKASNHMFRTPSPLFSYSISTSGLWKVQLYCPIIAMNDMGEPSVSTHDERLLFSLRYQQLEGVIQLAYKVIIKENWIDIAISVDNIRCDVNSLVSETLMSERGYGSEEKHFPSRISLQLTPLFQSDVLSVTVSKSSDNPIQEVGREKAVEASFEPPSSYLGFNFSAAETVTMSIKPWKFEQTVFGDSAGLHWYLHDGVNGKEIFSSKPSKLTFLQPRAWFRDRYSRAYRPFTKQGGVIFAGDEYGEKVWWKLCREALGKTMEWEMKGSIWLTYWPNKQRSFYTETRTLQFKEMLYLSLPNAP